MTPENPNISRRRLLGGGLALGGFVALGGLSACGGDDDDDDSSAGTTPGTTGGSGTTAPASGGGGSISMFGWDIADTTAGLGLGFEACRVAWQEQTGNELSFDGVPFGDFVATGTTRARAGELSDVVELLPNLNHAGIFPALAPTAKADYGALADEVTGWESALLDATVDGEYAGIPGGAQGTLFYYNKALFEQAGLDPEAAPTTWEEFEAACDALLAAGITPLGMSGVDGNLLWWAWNAFTPQFFTTADEVNKVRTGEIPLDDERFMQSLAPIASTYAKGYWNEDYASKQFADMEAAFGAGEVAIVPGLITSAINWRVFDDSLGKDAYGVFTAPLVEGGIERKQFFNPVLLYGLSTSTDEVELSRDWISFVVSKEGQEIMLRESGQFPNRSDVSVAEVADSPGAAAISAIVEEVGGVPAAQVNFNSAAAGAATQGITDAAVNDDLAGFLENLALLQSEG